MTLQYLGKCKNIDQYYKLSYTIMIFFQIIYFSHMHATMAPKPVCWQKVWSVMGIASRDINTSQYQLNKEQMWEQEAANLHEPDWVALLEGC
jgi:hypothetical protein